MDKNIKSIHIEKLVHDKLKKYCEKHGLKINVFVKNAILEKIENLTMGEK